MSKPAKHILLVSSGLSPQVVTEALWALMVERKVPIEELHVITTPKGADEITQTLAGPGGKVAKLLREYGLSPTVLLFSDRTVHKTTDDDVFTLGDNARFANEVAGFVRDLADRDEVTIHAFLAGGRKTMSVLVGFAMSLFGRRQDCLYHVLVSEGIEGTDFYYPPRKPGILVLTRRSDKKRIRRHSKDVRVRLAEVPFVRLRDRIGDIGKSGSYEAMVATAQATVDEIEAANPLVLDLKNLSLKIGDSAAVQLSKRELVIYLHFVRDKRDRCTRPAKNCQGCAACYSEITTYGGLTAWGDPGINQALEADAETVDLSGDLAPVFTQAKRLRAEFSSINSKIRSAVGRDDVAGRYYIFPAPDRTRDKRYGIPADRAHLTIV